MTISEQHIAQAAAIGEQLCCKGCGENLATCYAEGYTPCIGLVAIDEFGNTCEWLTISARSQGWVWRDNERRYVILQTGDPRLGELIDNFKARTTASHRELQLVIPAHAEDERTNEFWERTRPGYELVRPADKFKDLRTKARLWRRLFGERRRTWWNIDTIALYVAAGASAGSVTALLLDTWVATAVIATIGLGAACLFSWLRAEAAEDAFLTRVEGARKECLCGLCVGSLTAKPVSELHKQILTSTLSLGAACTSAYYALWWLSLSRLADGESSLLASLGVGLAGFAFAFLARGCFALLAMHDLLADVEQKGTVDFSEPRLAYWRPILHAAWGPSLVLGIIAADYGANWLNLLSIGPSRAAVLGATLATSAVTLVLLKTQIFEPVLAQNSWIAGIGFILGGETGAAMCASQLACHKTELAQFGPTATGLQLAAKRLENLLAWIVCLADITYHSILALLQSAWTLLRRVWPSVKVPRL